MVGYAAARKGEDGKTITMLALLLLAAMLATAYVIHYARRQVVSRITDLTGIIGRLAKDDFSFDLSRYQSRNEIGEMAKAVEILRLHGLEIQKIRREQEASAQTVPRTHAIVTATNQAFVHKSGMVLNLADEISSQNNLLVLNATIEAVPAGEADNDFTQVASEVKNVVGQTAKASKEILAKITEMQGATGGALETIGPITKTIEEMSSVACGVAAAAQLKNVTTDDILCGGQQASIGLQVKKHKVTQDRRNADDSCDSAQEVMNAVAEFV